MTRCVMTRGSYRAWLTGRQPHHHAAADFLPLLPHSTGSSHQASMDHLIQPANTAPTAGYITKSCCSGPKPQKNPNCARHIGCHGTNSIQQKACLNCRQGAHPNVPTNNLKHTRRLVGGCTRQTPGAWCDNDGPKCVGLCVGVQRTAAATCCHGSKAHWAAQNCHRQQRRTLLLAHANTRLGTVHTKGMTHQHTQLSHDDTAQSV